MKILQFCQKQHNIAGGCKLENVLMQALGDCTSLSVQSQSRQEGQDCKKGRQSEPRSVTWDWYSHFRLSQKLRKVKEPQGRKERSEIKISVIVAAFLSLCPFYLTENLQKQNLFLLVISEVVICQSGTAQASKGFFHAGGNVRRIVPNKTNPQAERTGGKDRMLSLKTSP